MEGRAQPVGGAPLPESGHNRSIAKEGDLWWRGNDVRANLIVSGGLADTAQVKERRGEER
jgi:hypothetical protein